MNNFQLVKNSRSSFQITYTYTIDLDGDLLLKQDDGVREFNNIFGCILLKLMIGNIH